MFFCVLHVALHHTTIMVNFAEFGNDNALISRILLLPGLVMIGGKSRLCQVEFLCILSYFLLLIICSIC